jgi:hypothetical protein
MWDVGFRIADFGLRISDFGLRIADVGLGRMLSHTIHELLTCSHSTCLAFGIIENHVIDRQGFVILVF